MESCVLSSSFPSMCQPKPSIAPALPPHLLADGAGYPRHSRLRRNDAWLGRASGDLQHELGADRILELRPFADRNDEGARAADDAILVIDVEIFDIQRRLQRPLQ